MPDAEHQARQPPHAVFAIAHLHATAIEPILSALLRAAAMIVTIAFAPTCRAARTPALCTRLQVVPSSLRSGRPSFKPGAFTHPDPTLRYAHRLDVPASDESGNIKAMCSTSRKEFAPVGRSHLPSPGRA